MCMCVYAICLLSNGKLANNSGERSTVYCELFLFPAWCCCSTGREISSSSTLQLTTLSPLHHSSHIIIVVCTDLIITPAPHFTIANNCWNLSRDHHMTKTVHIYILYIYDLSARCLFQFHYPRKVIKNVFVYILGIIQISVKIIIILKENSFMFILLSFVCLLYF